MTYRFVGSNSDIGDSIRLNHFGQSAELSDEQARDAVLGGCALVPEDVFTEIGFTGAELKMFSSVGAHNRAPVEFLEKKQRALIAVHELREQLEGGTE